ncbi:MAG: hypothetical protein INH37_17265, partial [Myxococcaceae bacterium]|nr:hypothetical protein [Myxococcaceae bacterium]
HDAAGNSATSAPVIIIVGMSADTTPPTVSVTAPAMGAMTGLSVMLAATAIDDVGVQRVEFELDGAPGGVATAAPHQTTSTVSAGPHSLVAVAFDAAGNSTRSAVVAFTATDPNTDGGQTMDAGTTHDAGSTTPDAGQLEQDAGTQPTDAGADARMGREGRQDLVLGGCGCNGVGVAPWDLAGLFVLLARVRRRR